jgi:DNA-binding phage protein
MMVKVSELPTFDAADYLETADDIALFLSDALTSFDTAEIEHAFATAARARGRSEAVAAALASGGPDAYLRALHALDLDLVAKPRSPAEAA